MKYRVDAYKDKQVTTGKMLHDSIDSAMELAFKVAKKYHCYCKIARVQA